VSTGRPRRARYRVRQFVGALAAARRPLTAAEVALARCHLPPAAWPLFDAMARADQRHSLRVMAALQARGQTQSALLQAALLHDCAKAAGGVRLWQRVAKVLLGAFWPAVLARLAAEPAPAQPAWRAGLWAHLHHPARGAELAAAAGCDPVAVALIRCHETPPGPGDLQADQLLRALQSADDGH
jgi:hypothetical protein